MSIQSLCGTWQFLLRWSSAVVGDSAHDWIIQSRRRLGIGVPAFGVCAAYLIWACCPELQSANYSNSPISRVRPSVLYSNTHIMCGQPTGANVISKSSFLWLLNISSQIPFNHGQANEGCADCRGRSPSLTQLEGTADLG